jgi:hypothetical protein
MGLVVDIPAAEKGVAIDEGPVEIFGFDVAVAEDRTPPYTCAQQFPFAFSAWNFPPFTAASN